MPSKYEQLHQEFEGTGVTVMKDGHSVSRQSDWILYSVPAEFIDSVVATYGPCKSRRRRHPSIDDRDESDDTKGHAAFRTMRTARN